MATINFRKSGKKYILIVDGDEFKTPLTKILDIEELKECIEGQIFHYEEELDYCCTIQESSEDPALGIILDVYLNKDLEDFVDSTTFWYEDFVGTEPFIDPAGGSGLHSHI
jgi:hypothetical protein